MVLRLCAVLCLFFALSAGALDRARVRPAALPLYNQASLASKTSGELRHGELVRIDLKLNSPEGEWCLVSAEGKSTYSGYVKCSDLNVVRPAAAKPKTVPPPSPRSLSSELCGDGQGDTWSQRYNWTPQQLAAAREMADRLLGSCARKAGSYQQAFRQIGVTAQTFDTLVKGWQSVEDESHCSDRLVSFFDQLVNVATPEQRRLLDADQREIRRMMKVHDLPVFCSY